MQPYASRRPGPVGRQSIMPLAPRQKPAFSEGSKPAGKATSKQKIPVPALCQNLGARWSGSFLLIQPYRTVREPWWVIGESRGDVRKQPTFVTPVLGMIIGETCRGIRKHYKWQLLRWHWETLREPYKGRLIRNHTPLIRDQRRLVRECDEWRMVRDGWPRRGEASGWRWNGRGRWRRRGRR